MHARDFLCPGPADVLPHCLLVQKLSADPGGRAEDIQRVSRVMPVSLGKWYFERDWDNADHEGNSFTCLVVLQDN